MDSVQFDFNELRRRLLFQIQEKTLDIPLEASKSPNIFRCPSCASVFRDKNSLNTHLSLSHWRLVKGSLFQLFAACGRLSPSVTTDLFFYQYINIYKYVKDWSTTSMGREPMDWFLRLSDWLALEWVLLPTKRMNLISILQNFSEYDSRCFNKMVPILPWERYRVGSKWRRIRG